jgi:hypothetical protein
MRCLKSFVGCNGAESTSSLIGANQKQFLKPNMLFELKDLLPVIRRE